ncbi:MAG TPA: FGGY family carbohydrate kinase, partial [Thermoleophilia bacterium]|nr:FGGY family carbohydrate kinase [Thermoleophilia bacterium]
LCRRLLRPGEGARGGGHVVVAAASALGPCLVLADADGRPLRPAILYGVDTRAAAEIDELEAALGPVEILARCGSPLTSQAVGPKLRWVARHEPDVLRQARLLFSAGSWLVHRLTGQYVLDHHTASQWVPLYDVHRNGWIDEWAAAVVEGLGEDDATAGRGSGAGAHVPELPPLPPLLWAQEPVGLVSREAAAATGLPAGIPVAAGSIDAFVGLVGAGLRGPGRLLLVYGTTMFLAEAMTRARPDPRLWSPTSLLPGSRNLAAGTVAGGALAAWVRDLTGEPDLARLTAGARQVPAGAGGLVVLPYFSGERSPLFDPKARGVVEGLTLAHTSGHLFRAALEGTACAVRHNLDVMRGAGCVPVRLVASDAALKGTLWPQIVSDVTGLEQDILTGPAVTTVGSGLLAAMAAGLADLDTDWSGLSHTVVPDPGVAAVYDDLYERYRGLYPATLEIEHQLAADSQPAPAAGQS